MTQALATHEDGLLLFRQGGTVKRYAKPMPIGEAPALVMVNPKYPHNVGSAIRAAACYGVDQVWYTGHRVSLATDGNERIPREERMRSYQNVKLYNYERPLDLFTAGTPVAVEFLPDCTENLISFQHPANPIYVFGPEDGSIPQHYRQLCHRFVHIPTRHCLNLATAIATVLYDRRLKTYLEITRCR